MFKVFAIVSVGLFSAVYWLTGAFVSSVMALWLVFFPVQVNTSQVYQQPSSVQLSGTVEQATPTRLQGAVNVQ